MGVKDGPLPFELPGQAYSNHSNFLVPTKENTLTWGDTQSIPIDPAAAGESNAKTSAQLVRVMRQRPTTFTVAVQLQLGENWDAELATTLTVDLIIGVGQAKCTIRKTYPIPAPASNTLPVNDIFTVPATALQAQGSLSISAAPLNAGIHGAVLTILAAPVYA